jgi:hypothetical protein
MQGNLYLYSTEACNWAHFAWAIGSVDYEPWVDEDAMSAHPEHERRAAKTLRPISFRTATSEQPQSYSCAVKTAEGCTLGRPVLLCVHV